jgi:hypothetical protein
MAHNGDSIRKALARADSHAVVIDGWVRVWRRADGYRVATVDPDGWYAHDTQPMSRVDAYRELYYLLAE